jgi:hypothetical protein
MTSRPSRSTRASSAPNSSRARIAAPDRRRARASKKRPRRISVVMTPATSKYVWPSSTAARATSDQPQAASVPIEMSVSIVAVPCRAFTGAARWKRRPETKTTGVARASATHSQPPNCSGGIIAIAVSGPVRTAARRSARRSERAEPPVACSWRRAARYPAASTAPTSSSRGTRAGS